MIAVTRSQRLAVALLGLGLASSAACRRDTPRNDAEQTRHASSAVPSSAPPKGPSAAITLLEWKESAYGTTLFVEGSTVLVLTPTAVIRVTEGAPPQKMTVPLGVGPALMGDSIVYWHDGAARAVSKHGSEPRVLGRIKQPPQRFVASDDRLAWIQRDDDGTFSVQAFDGKTARVIHQAQDHVATATMVGDRVFFVASHADGSWRIGSVSTSSKATVFSPAHRGRTPSMLVPARDGIYFYDGPTRSVRRSSLERETVYAENVICSPLAVSDRVVCGHVEGVFEIPGIGKPPRVLSPEKGGPIAAIAADDKRAVWVADTGENQLAVRAVALPPLQQLTP